MKRTPTAVIETKGRRRRTQEDVGDRLGAALGTGVDVANRTIYLIGVVDMEMAGRAVVALDLMGQESGPIRILLASAGGDVDAGFAIYDAIRTCPQPVLVEGYGLVQSMATCIMQAATVRVLAPECRVMVHEGSVGLHEVSPRKLEDLTREIVFLHDRYCAIISERSGLSLDKARELCGQESFMSAEEAVGLGLADAILRTSNPAPMRPARKVKK